MWNLRAAAAPAALRDPAMPGEVIREAVVIPGTEVTPEVEVIPGVEVTPEAAVIPGEATRPEGVREVIRQRDKTPHRILKTTRKCSR
jgi:hypothetical protein